MLAIHVYLTAVLFLSLIGLYSMAFKRNMIRILLGLEIILNAANLSFIAFSARFTGQVDLLGQSIVVMSIVLGGCVVAVGLSMVLNAYKHYKTLDVRELRRLKW
ncbi:NADH-quinone oxidoreductase subunit NuoK [Candidatus Bathyarchaeota archaeon]|nr:NADH-quinone oxidoreductase subunit NuoK [Candidatus Bathyarchaeota archaeon]